MPRPPQPRSTLFCKRFSRVRSATTSFNSEASRRRSLTSPDVAERAVSPPKAAFASLKELLGPAIIHRGHTARRYSPRRANPSNTIRIFFSAEYCRGAWRRLSFSTCSAGALSGPDFCFNFAPYGNDEPEILLREVLVSEALTANTPHYMALILRRQAADSGRPAHERVYES